MSRIVKTTSKVKIGIKICNYYTDKTNSSTILFIDNTISGMKYIENDELKSVTGRISDIDVSFLKVSKDFDIIDDSTVSSITIDASTKNKSKVIILQPNNIVDYNAEEKEVEYVKIIPVMVVDFKSDLSDGSSSSMSFKQGMKLFNVQIQKANSILKGDFEIKSFMYRINYSYDDVKVYGMILSGDTEEKILFEDIKVCGTEGIKITSNDDISNIIAESEIGAGIVLPANTFTDSINITKSITMVGNKENEIASFGSRATDSIAKNETIVLNTVTGEANADIVIKGVTFTENSYIDPNGASSITFKNCKFVETVPNASKSYMIKDNGFRNDDEKPLLLQIEGCYFGNNTDSENNKMYNLFEIRSRLANGSYIKNCYFAKKCALNNIISLYDVEQGATIEISNNHFESSKNAIRVGFTNHPKCTLKINNNIIDETDIDEYAGLILVQPYGIKTETFEDVTIEMYNNKYTKDEDKQIGYLYCGGGDTKITSETAPKVHTDGYFNFNF